MRRLLASLAVLLALAPSAWAGEDLDAADRLVQARARGDEARAGRHLLALDRLDEAAEAFRRAGDRQGLALALIRQGRFGEVRAVLPDASATELAEVLVEAGEFGRARKLLDAAEAERPDDPVLATLRGRLELAAGRPVRAVGPFKRALALAPADQEAAHRLVRAWLAAGMPVRAHEAFTEASRTLKPAEPLLADGVAALAAIGDHKRVEAATKSWLKQKPDSEWALRLQAAALAGTGAHARAAVVLRAAFALAPPTEATLDQYLAYLARARPEDMAEATLAQLRRDFPTAQAVWRRSAQQLAEAQAGQRARRALAEKAAAAVPGLAWPWLDLAALLDGFGDREGARQALDHGLAAIPPERAGQRAQLHRRQAALLQGEAALAELDEFRRLGGALAEWHRARREVFAAAGRPDEAAAEAWAWATLRPDEADGLAAVFLPEAGERLGWPRLFAHLSRVVERNPSDPARLLVALERHGGPAGSHLLALAVARELDRLDPDDPRVLRGREVRAEVLAELGRLGRIVELDLAAMSVQLERPDGVMVTLRHHPASGRPVRRQEGPAWTEARWEDGGTRLAELWDSAGNRVTLGYEAGRLASVEGRGFAARLAADGSAVVDDAAAYNRVLPVLAAWGRGEAEELPMADAVLDRLLAAEAGGAKAELAVAAWLVERLADRRDHALAARRRLESVFDRARAREPALALEAARLWAKWAQAIFPDGLPPEAWSRWTMMRDWAGGRGKLPGLPARSATTQ